MKLGQQEIGVYPILDRNIAAYYERIDYIRSFMTMSINKHKFLGELDAISLYNN